MDRKIVELLVQDKSFNKIAKQLKVGKVRIRKIANLAKTYGYLEGKPFPKYPLGLFEYPSYPINGGPVSDVDKELLKQLDWIKDRNEAGWHLVTIYEELPPSDIEITKSSFYRFIKRHNINENDAPKTGRIIPEIITAPGESLQLDWGKLCDVIIPETGKKKTLWFLSGVLGHSRYMMTRLVWSNGIVETLDALQSMFNELGGVPAKLTSDNPKCFATVASKFEPILNPAFERFCSHYGTIAELLPPRDPQKKGKVERAVPYVRRLYEAYGEFKSLEDSQRYMDKKMILANNRKHGTTKLRPVDSFLQTEASTLMELPNLAYTVEEYHQGKVRKDGYVRFRNKYYSVGEEYVGEKAFVIANSSIVEIFYKGNLLETHKRIDSSYVSKSTKKHHLKPHEQVMEDHGHLISRSEKMGPKVKEMIESILHRGRGYIDTRAIWGILNLDKDYSLHQVDKACGYALECDQLGYQAVMRFINVMPKEEKLIKKSVGNKFTRDPSEYGVQLGLLN